MPRARNAPKLWPAMPSNATWIVSSGKPSWPYLCASTPDSIAPTERLALRIRCVRRTGCLLVDGRPRRRDQLMVERAREAVILLFLLRPRDVRRHLRLVEDAREVEAARLPVRDAGAHVEHVGAPDHLLERAKAQLRHQLAHFLGDEEEVIDDVLGLVR